MQLFIKRLSIATTIALAMFVAGLMLSGCTPTNIAESATTAKELKVRDRYTLEDSGLRVVIYADNMQDTFIYVVRDNLGGIINTSVVKR